MSASTLWETVVLSRKVCYDKSCPANTAKTRKTGRQKVVNEVDHPFERGFMTESVVENQCSANQRCVLHVSRKHRNGEDTKSEERSFRIEGV